VPTHPRTDPELAEGWMPPTLSQSRPVMGSPLARNVRLILRAHHGLETDSNRYEPMASEEFGGYRLHD
jgi:hypothetical protein